MKPKEIQKYIELVEKSRIAELEVSHWGKKVRIRKSPDNNLPITDVHENIMVAQTPGSTAPVQSPITPTSEVTPIAAPSTENEKYTEIRSPMVGTFYRKPDPDAEPYVQIGNIVSSGQTLCIIEAMKLMNTIEAEFPCRILEIIVDDAKPVEYNQVLFKVEKL